jgi:hypothetical protein
MASNTGRANSPFAARSSHVCICINAYQKTTCSRIVLAQK